MGRPGLGPRRGTRSRAVRPALEPLDHRILPAVLPPGFVQTTIAEGLTAPTAMQLAPDGRFFVAEQRGTVRVVENGQLLSTPALTLTVDQREERGLVGLTL